MFQCDTCVKDFSRGDSLARHKKRKNPCSPKVELKRNREDTEQTRSGSEKIFTIKDERKKRSPESEQIGNIPTFANNSSKMSKPPNPKISALIDAIVNDEDEPPEKIQRKDSEDDDEKKHDLIGLVSKVVPSDEDSISDGDDIDENEDDYEDDEEDDDDNESEEACNEKPQAPHLSKEINIIFNRFCQLFQESKRGVKQNKGTLIILLDLLKDCEAIYDNDYEKAYDAIENVCK